MSKWTHNICLECWTEGNPNRIAYSVKEAEQEVCCVCGAQNKDGIYFRADGATLQCKGECSN